MFQITTGVTPLVFTGVVYQQLRCVHVVTCRENSETGPHFRAVRLANVQSSRMKHSPILIYEKFSFLLEEVLTDTGTHTTEWYNRAHTITMVQQLSCKGACEALILFGRTTGNLAKGSLAG